MINYLLPFIISLVMAMVVAPFVRTFIIKKNIGLQKPRERDIHQKPIPRLGGVIIFFVFWLLVFGYQIFYPEKLHFVDERILGIDKNLLGVFLGSLILLTVGVIDDVKGVNAWVKLIFQIISGIMIVAFGVNVWWFANPLGGANIELGWLTYIFVPIWVVLIINVINWLDGIDGLASGISGITLLILLFLSATPLVNQPATALLCAILAGAVFGFLPYNFNPAKIFLGDSGSMFIGFIIAVAAIISGGKIATVALVLGIPILDAFWVILRRIISGNSPMKADKYHLHHRFLQAGFSQKQIVIIMYAVSLIFGILALSAGTRGKLEISLWLVGIMFIIGLGLIFLKKKNSKEK